MKGKIYFPQNKKGKEGRNLIVGKTILGHLRNLGLPIASECGGRGKCGKCIVRIEKGQHLLTQQTTVEKVFLRRPGERLACQAKIARADEDIYVFIKNLADYSILTEGKRREIELQPLVHQETGKLFYGKEKIGLFQGKIYGLAVDVGTTTLVLEIIDLKTGRTIATLSRQNPQTAYGGDVISRIEYIMVSKEKLKFTTPAERRKKLSRLKAVIIDAVNETLASFEKEKGKEIKKYIYDVVVVGNSTMRNISFGLDVCSLGSIPYEPLHKEPILRKAVDVGLKVNPRAKIYSPLLVGGQSGADTLANMLAVGISRKRNPVMIIDIGTNAETIIGNEKRILSCSAAAGGAFEGATINSGVGAIAGAIKNIRIEDGKVKYKTIGNKPPVGICGSGLIDLLSELLREKIMSAQAKLKSKFFVTDGMSITQADIYQLVTAKAGLKTGQDLLMKYYGTSREKIERIYLSGAFGNFVNIDNAIKIGLLPPAREKIVKIGNGALEGAREMLISRRAREDGERLREKIEHIKLNEREKNYAYLMAGNMYFK